jgi:hypothetical protein
MGTMRNAVFWLQPYQDMHMVTLNCEHLYPPPVYPAALIQERFQPFGYFTYQDTLPVFWYPHEVVLQPVTCVCPLPVSDHGQIMPQIPSLRQLKHASLAGVATGGHSSPPLKGRGFLAG